MERVEKTVFLSYRRTNFSWAVAIYQELTKNGFDVFLDYTSIPSGDFETIIIENIKANAHFLVLLTPSALERCSEPGDWLRREIETALDSKRNIVPLMLEGFDFGTPSIGDHLIGKLETLKRYSGLSIPANNLFFRAMDDLRSRFLNVRLSAVLHPASPVAQEAAKDQKAAAAAAELVTQDERTAQQWFERGVAATDLHEQIGFYTEAIRLKPDFLWALNNRGVARDELGDVEGALDDYTKAIDSDPTSALPMMNRGIARAKRNEFAQALAAFDEAIRLDPDYADAFSNRGETYRRKGDFGNAIQDFTTAIHLNPWHGNAFYNRSLVRRELGDVHGADSDLSESKRLGYNPD